ncbi:flagellar basal-body rod protein FlgF [Paenibacillus sp. JX-17]|uniref:Flagellar basal-body rod protein FlgF n=1 Tax=Paenibacillus lacisoli TaxID=3064525 RepID=A0ABT9CCC8_9BACL|nr:flagellar basal-body rod protein FlgF [Paenibacillus sp. JX-17]MDO7906535.1 flagellar basal-body rod protein FlgF [Paenibacillus sp. JX-17]
MNNSMINAMVSMNSIQQRLDVISDNIANVDTVGYKGKQTSFEDTLTRVQQQPETYKQDGRSTPLGFNMGYGVRLGAITKDMSQGPLKETGQPTDLAMEGSGLFAVEANGTKAWTRDGSFHFNPDPANPKQMVLVTKEGYPVLNRQGQPVTAPVNSKVAIDDQGNVLVRIGNAAPVVGAQIQFVDPQRPDGLTQQDDNLFVLSGGLTENDVFGANAALTIPADSRIRSGYLEQSNVDLTTEMTQMMQIQRTYQLAARALTSSDTMMNLANNMRG